jgi:GNAT superfamily N-acetyltransferase
MTDDLTIRPLDRPGDLGWVLLAHGELYADEFGWVTEPVTARILADFAERQSPQQSAWIAELAGRRVGCVFCVRVDDETAKLRLLLVDPAVRGRHLGRRLVDQCVEFATRVGYRRLVLWTNEPLAVARRLYLAAGFRLVSESRHDAFGPDLLGQEYELDLAERPERLPVAT